MEYLNEKREFIYKEIQKILDIWDFVEPLNKAIRYILQSGGKRIRPILTLLSCDAVGGNFNSAINGAIAIELIHNASLLFDDVIDSDDLRRGRITVHKKWNKSTAILAGEILASKALELISNKPTILDLYLKTIGKMIEGQVLDISNSLNTSSGVFESKNEKEIFEILRKRFRQRAIKGMEWEESRDLYLIADLTDFEEEREYFEMISYKTSSLIKLATRIGAILGGGTQEEIEALTHYGFYLGLAFQVRDDLIGLFSNEKTIGKPIGSDIRHGKLNLYTIFALRNLDDIQLGIFLDLVRKAQNNDAFQKIHKILTDSGALKYVKNKLKLLAQMARNHLTILDNSDSKDILNNLITFTIERRF